ncbi:hypothetical protein [Moorena producens]|uniref:hypothetical protein n=1 Tax=Moorena producens TaxID=1155739 RepID=UPI0013144482|nr:hypothetical protein [Moorena producens]
MRLTFGHGGRVRIFPPQPILFHRFPIPDSRFPTPDSRFPFPSWEGLGVGSDSRLPIPDSRFPTPDSRFSILNSQFSIPSSIHCLERYFSLRIENCYSYGLFNRKTKGAFTEIPPVISEA